MTGRVVMVEAIVSRILITINFIKITFNNKYLLLNKPYNLFEEFFTLKPKNIYQYYNHNYPAEDLSKGSRAG
jgi:hypothetical protein